MSSNTTNSTTNTMIDRILRAGLATPALALTIFAGAALAQQGGMSGRTYEVIIEGSDDQAEQEQKNTRARTALARAAQQDGQNARVVIEINQVIDGQTISVSRINDEPITVKIDGQVIDEKHYEMEDGRVIITHPATGRKHEVTMPQGSLFRTGDARARLQPAQPVAPLPPFVRGGTGGGNVNAQFMDSRSQPKVMLGVVMGQPDAVVLEHLGLPADKAVVLERVIDGLPAAKAGLKAKDIIIGFGEHAQPRSADEIREVLAKAEPGSKVKVKVLRKGEPLTMELKFEEFDGAALGRAMAEGRQVEGQAMPEGLGQGWFQLERNRNDQMAHAEQALHEAAEMLARLEGELGSKTADAHQKASKAIQQAIEAMKQGDLAGMEIDEIRQIQQDAVERLRREFENNRGGQRFWAEPGEGGQGFALTVPGRDEQQARWGERLEMLEKRLDELEQSVDRAVDRLESRTEAMMERLLERLERALEREQQGPGNR